MPKKNLNKKQKKNSKVQKAPESRSCLAFADSEGRVYDFPGIEPSFRTGRRFVQVDEKELIRLPAGSYLFTLPGRYPVFYNRRNNDFNHITVSPDGDDICAVSSFLASGYLRTYLPAYISGDGAERLSLWAYGGVVFKDDDFYVPALRIDPDPRSDYSIHQNEDELTAAVDEARGRLPHNRLVTQLAKCAVEYNCLCSRNFFLGRHEAPIPTSPSCNSNCVGCLSYQKPEAGIVASQQRLDFSPLPDEIAAVIADHFSRVQGGVASFGQGCEGEPLMRAGDLSRAIALVRENIDHGTINLNTNGSRPDGVKEMIRAGLDSIRISLNSPTEKYYEAYYRPSGYSYTDVMRSLDAALDAGIFVSINLFFLPGFTDMETEAAALYALLKKFPVNMIQTRNLNIDPDYYFECIHFEESPPIGIRKLLSMIRKDFPQIRLGYYNPAVGPSPARR